MVIEIELCENLICHDNHEISTVYPYPIRKKSTGKIVKEWMNDNGYYHLNLEGKSL